MRRHGFLAVLLTGVAASSAWLMNQQHSLNASEDDVRSFREAYSGTDPVADAVEQQDGVRLNYFDTRWDRVLKDLASQAELTLVMDRIPHGSFARRDRTRYEIGSAVRIVNAELESQGFRLIHQGNFLVVLKLDQARARYSRPVLNDWQAAEAASKRETESAASPFRQISSRRNDESSPRVTWAQDGQSQNGQPQGNSVSEQPFQTQVVPQPPTAEVAKDPGPATTTKVAVKNRKAAEIARSIYLVFESRASLVKDGLNSLPTFVVRESEEVVEGQKPLFRIAIDQASNSLILDGPESRVDNLKRLVAQLDRAASQDGETTRLVPKDNVDDKTAQALNAQIKRMMTMKAQQAGDQNPLAAQEVGGDDAALNLRGPVDVQVMDDVGVMMLRGNEADVRKVEAIIQQLEELSEGSLPGIHLLELQHVNSEAMAELLSEVYEELSELRQRGNADRKSATFFPVVQPNALLILASEIELEPILELADKLDRSTDPNSEFKAFNLKYAVASQVATAVESFYSERGGLAVRPRVIADVRTNTIIVQGRGNDLAEVGRLIESFDKDEPGAVHRVEIIALNHATATELGELLSTAIQSVSSPPQQAGGQGGFGGGNQGAQELQDGKSVALEFLSSTGAGRELVRSGILVDVRVNADPRSNSLILSAPEASIPLLKALIAELDQSPAAVAEIKVFALRNSDAEQTVELLTALFEDQNQEDQLGIQIAGAADAASSLIPVRFSADLRTNTILAVGSVEALSVVEAILLRLDTTEARQRDTTVIPMRNVQASIVADALDAFLEQQADLQESAEGLVSNVERLRQEVLVTADDNSNSLIVSATPEYYSQITGIISELDATPPQVIIQALLVEVQLDNADEFGVELGFQDPTLLSRSLLDALQTVTTTVFDANGIPQSNAQTIVSANGAPGFNFNNTSTGIGNNVSGLIPGQSGVNTSPSTVATQGISNFSLGRQNSDLGFGGFVFSAQSDAVSVLVRALAARRTVHVLSRPQIRTTNNVEASIQVGQQVPVVNGVTVNDNFVTPQIDQQDVGIILRVTPRVTQDGTISMAVYAEKSSLSPGGVPVFTDATTGNVVESVIIDSAIADTVVAVPNGQTIVIGGMITKSDETLERKVPWLGDLPLLGNLFRYDGTNTARSELLIFLTPRIIYGDADSELIKQVEAERLHFIESDAEELHGPLYSVPPSGLDQTSMFHEGPPSEADFMLYGAPGQQSDYSAGQPIPEQEVVLPPQTNTDTEGDSKAKTAQMRRQSMVRQVSASQTEAERRAAAAWVQRAVDSSERKAEPVRQASSSRSVGVNRSQGTSTAVSEQDLYEPAPKRKWYQKLLKGGRDE
ncbi:MAG: secretin N-terminal domain-containing protein [Fuerstiella sp.]